MVRLECHAMPSDEQVAVGIGISYCAAANDLRRKLERYKPQWLKMDFEGVLRALEREHYCDTVGTASHTGMFQILRVNAYSKDLSLVERIRQFFFN